MEFVRKIGNFVDKIMDISISIKLEYAGYACLIGSYFSGDIERDKKLLYVGGISLGIGMLLRANNRKYDEKIRELEIKLEIQKEQLETRLQGQDRRVDKIEDEIKDRNFLNPLG